MKSAFIKLSLFSVVIASLLTSCKNSGGSFQTDEATGIKYKIIKHGNGTTKPAMGDYVRLKMVATAVTTGDKDTVVINTGKAVNPKDSNSGTIRILLRKIFNGCLEQGITLLTTGDSAVIKVNADSLFLKTFGQKQLPKYVKAGSDVTFNITLSSFMTNQQLMQLQQAMLTQRKSIEGPSIAKYLADNHYTNVKPTADSIYILERKDGKGKPIKEGDSVKINYTGMLLDGSVFDASARPSNPSGVFPLVYSKNMALIKGWVELLGTMREGDKFKVLLPSALAYGPRQMNEQIQAYTPLLFEIEVVKVKQNAPAPKK